MNNITIRAMLATDWNAVSEIYVEGISTGIATFETCAPTYAAWDAAHMKNCRFVAERNGKILGWVALSPVSNRCVYGGVAEISVYIAGHSRGKGLGKLLLEHVINAS